MAPTEGPPRAVLQEAILDAIGEESVCAAVFVTFQLETRFFEDHILGPLLGVPDRGGERVRRVLVQQKLSRLATPLVLYDHAGLVRDGAAVQNVEYVPVRISSGCLHAKHVLLLLGDPSAPRAMVMVTTSANLTQSGWWTNVEGADVRRLERGQDTPLATDVRALVEHITRWRGEPSAQPSLQRLAAFASLLKVSQQDTLPRLWLGAERLDGFLAPLMPRGAELELIAPFVDDDAIPVRRLVESLRPSETRVMLPVDRDESISAGKSWMRGVTAAGAQVATLRGDRSMGARSDYTRFVHAKVIRASHGRRCFTLVGSPNLSIRGHAGWQVGGGNIETAILVEGDADGAWLSRGLGSVELPSSSLLPPEEATEPRFIGARVQVDWATHAVDVRVAVAIQGPVYLGRAGQVATSKEASLGVKGVPIDVWHRLDAAESAVLLTLLEDSSVVAAWADDFDPQTVLVEAHHAELAPSRMDGALTHVEILHHWALLEEEARQTQLVEILGEWGEGDPEAPIGATSPAADRGDTLFDAYSGVIHAFLMLRVRLAPELKQRPPETRQAAALLLGRGPDSLPTLLRGVEAAPDLDGVYRLVTWLCAQELWGWATGLAPSLGQECPVDARLLEESLRKVEPLWEHALAGVADVGIDPTTLQSWLERWWSHPIEGLP